MKVFSALLFAVLAAGSANAAQYVRSFDFNVTDAGGPQPNQTGSFSLRFDDANARLVSLDAISYIVNGYAYSVTNAGAEFFGTAQVRIGGTASGLFFINSNTDDFFLRFALTSLTPQTFSYATAGTPGFFGEAANVSLRETTASVPEPATWAMFIGGFGLIGATMRRRKVSVSFAKAA